MPNVPLGAKSTLGWKPLIFKNFYLFIFKERGRKGEREGKKHQCVVASPLAPTGDLACNPGMCPAWESTVNPLVCSPCSICWGAQARAKTTDLQAVIIFGTRVIWPWYAVFFLSFHENYFLIPIGLFLGGYLEVYFIICKYKYFLVICCYWFLD